VEISFEYRALDLLADYQPEFAYFPGIWKKTIEPSSEPRVQASFTKLVYALISEALVDLGKGMDEDEFDMKLGDVTERDGAAIKTMRDLGVNSILASCIITYVAGRRNLIDDERAWQRFVQVLEDQISIQAC
jgi:hypothetical protein